MSNRKNKGVKVKAASELDLHGCTVAEALEMLDNWLSRSAVSGCENLKVVHGIGTGKLKAAVHKRLSELKVVRNFKISLNNPGATDVYL